MSPDSSPGWSARYAGSHRDGEQVQRLGDDLRVEVAPAHHGFHRRKHEWIVRGAVCLYLDDPADVGERVPRGSVDLWHAAQAVGVLDARIPMAMGLADLGIGEQVTEPRRALGLSGMGPGALDGLVKRLGRSAQRFE
jgi:hypothetical protein